MIDALSTKITRLIKINVSSVTEEKAEIIAYGLKLVIYEILVFILVFSVSFMLGVFKYFLVFFIVFGSLRISVGGSHSRSRLGCIISYVLSIFSVILISKYLWASSYLPGVLVFLINFVIVLKYAPGDTLEKPIISKRIKRRLKTASLLLTSLYFVLAIVMWYWDKTIYNVIVLATLPVMFLLTPIGYKVSGSKKSSEAL